MSNDPELDALVAKAKAVQAAKLSGAPSPTDTPTPSSDPELDALRAKAQEVQKAKLGAAPSDHMADAEAGLQGFGQGASFGYLPQLQAIAEPAFAKVGDLATGSDTYKDLPDYTTRRDQWAGLQKKLADTHPKSYMGGQIAGALNTAVALPAGALGAGAGIGARVAAQVGTGLALRGLQNPGETPGEVSPLQLGDRWNNAAHARVPIPYTNMSVPAIGVDAALPLAGPALRASAGATRGVANSTAFKALGPYARSVGKALGNGSVDKIGGEMLDSGAIGGMPKSYSTLQEKLSALKGNVGKNLDSVYDEAGQKFGSDINKIGFDPIRDKAEIMAGVRADLGDKVGANAAAQKVEDYLDEVAARNGDAPNEAAQAAYQQQRGDFAQKLANYRKGQQQYRSSVGQAGADAAQPVLPGMIDDLQRTTPRQTSIELNGAPASIARPGAIPEMTQQSFLPDLPDMQSEFGAVKGGGRAESAQRAASGGTPGIQKDFLDSNTKENISLFGQQGEMSGLDSTPRSFTDAQVPGVSQRGLQSEIPIEPIRPEAPIAPGDIRNPLSPRRTQNLKTNAADQIEWSRNPFTPDPVNETAFGSLRNQLSNRLDDQIQGLGGGELLDKLKANNQQYGNLAEAESIVAKRNSHHIANRFLSPSDYGVGLIGAGAGALMDGTPEERMKHAAMGAAFGLANKGARLYGGQMIAPTLNNASKLMNAGAGAVENSPIPVQSVWNHLYSNKKDKK